MEWIRLFLLIWGAVGLVPRLGVITGLIRNGNKSLVVDTSV